jgi:hypothetical protein
MSQEKKQAARAAALHKILAIHLYRPYRDFILVRKYPAVKTAG